MGEPLISGERMDRVTFRAPDDLLDEIDELREQQNRKRSPVIRDALRRYVQVESGEVPDYGPHDDLQTVVDRLTHHVQKLERQLDD